MAHRVTLIPGDGVGPELLKIDELRRRLGEGAVQEVVIATDADKDGETTAAYLGKLLSSHNGLRVTRLALGLPLGSHLEYADHATLARSFEGRHVL